MRKALYLILIAGATFGQTPQPNDTVLAWKPQTPYMHGGSGWPAMRYNYWIKSLAWLTADSDVFGSGTNTQWLCYAKTCAGNATQPVVNSQPLRVLTNGVWALQFDGTDDRIGYGNQSQFNFLSNTQSFSVVLWINLPAADASTRRLFIKRNATDGGSLDGYQLTRVAAGAGGTLVFQVTLNSTRFSKSVAYTANTWAMITCVWDGTASSIYRNTTAGTGSVALGETANTSLFIGGSADLGSGQGLIADIVFFSEALSSDDIAYIFNQTKGRYGL